MTIVFIRTLIIYFIVLFVIRIMGKAELSKMSPFQMIIIFMIAELATIPIESPEVSMLTGITAIFTLMFLQVLISTASLKSEKIKNFFSGKPSILIDRGQINHKELKALRITINDLMEQLRLANASSICEVEYAIMEANGDLSVIQRAENKPLTPQDVDIKKSREQLPVVFISDGFVYSKNIIKAGWTENRLFDTLHSLDIKVPSEVFLAFCDGNSRLHVFMNDSNGSLAREVTR